MAARLATCSASAAASCSYVPSSRCRKPGASMQASANARGSCLPLTRNGMPCIAAEDPSVSSQAARFACRLRPASAGFGASPAASRSLFRGVVCEVAVELGGARSSKEEAAPVEVGARIRVKGSVKVYHVTKLPELDLDGLVGEVKEVLGIWKGKQVSANLPYKVQFQLEAGGKPVKFFAHLKEGEFEVVDSGSQ